MNDHDVIASKGKESLRDYTPVLWRCWILLTPG